MLLRLEDVMAVGDRVPRVSRDASVKEALFAITDKGYGAVAVEGPSGELVGIFTDGDLRRLMEREGVGSLERPVGEVMTRNPKVMGRDKLAAEALKLMEEMEISVVLVVDGARVEGIVHLHDLLKAGVA